MTILWCGGEDIDFPNGSMPTVTTTAGRFLANYARCALGLGESLQMAKSTVFPGGAITSGWMAGNIMTTAVAQTTKGLLGFGLGGTSKGLFVGIGATSSSLSLLKFDESTWTILATAPGTPIATSILYRLDIQIISYGAAATVNVYLDGAFMLTYTGDVTVSGVTELDSVFLYNFSPAYDTYFSGFIVADEDTRTFELVTYAPSAAGDANAWTGAYTTVDETTLDDSDVVYTNTPDLDVQYNLTATPAGTFAVKQVKVAARAAITAGASAATLELGVKTGGTINVDAGHALTTAWETQERYMATNPVTAGAWTTAELDALQINLQSET